MRLLMVQGSRIIRSITTFMKWPLAERVKLSDNLLDIEKHWKEKMNEQTNLNSSRVNEKKKYILPMFPYPSGRLHMGHMRVYTISDVLSQYYRLAGYDVIHPIGWDAFGLPAENAARERGSDPRQWTYDNIAIMREQLLRTGVRFDWEREIYTCDPKYYKWTQWIFCKLYEHGLIKRTLAEVNWDPVDKTVLATEQIDSEGKSWRSGAVAEKRKLRQWMVETPKYAKRLSKGLKQLSDQWEEAALIQSHWIGQCDVYRFLFPVKHSSGEVIPDEFLDLRLTDPVSLANSPAVVISESHALAHHKRKGTPHLVGCDMLNGVSGVWIPIISLPDELFKIAPSHLGVRLTHPEADKEWAQLLDIPLKPPRTTMVMNLNDTLEIAQFGGFGGYETSRSLTDWVVSRQRSWGTPIPMILGEDGSSFAVLPLEELPLLQRVDKGRRAHPGLPGGYGYLECDTLDTFFDSAWYYLRFLDPNNEEKLVDFEKAKQAMPVHVYVGGIEHAAVHMFFARFICHFLYDIGVSPVEEPFRDLVPQGIVKGRTFTLKSSGEYISNADVIEKDKVFRKSGTGEELNVFYEKMSKSKHNGVDPSMVLERDGVDLSRLQLLYSAAPKADINWGDMDIRGLKKWIDRVSSIVSRYVEVRQQAVSPSPPKLDMEKIESELRENYNYFVRTVSTLLSSLHIHNTAIARLIGFTNSLRKLDPSMFASSAEAERVLRSLIIMLQVFAPHTSAELWSAIMSVPVLKELDNKELLTQPWPTVDKDAHIDNSIIIAGKSCVRVSVLRTEVEDLNAEEALERSRQKEHGALLRLLEQRGHRIVGAKAHKMEGLFYNVVLDVEPQINEDEVGKILDVLAHQRLQEQKRITGEQKKEKRIKKKKELG